MAPRKHALGLIRKAGYKATTIRHIYPLATIVIAANARPLFTHPWSDDLGCFVYIVYSYQGKSQQYIPRDREVHAHIGMHAF